MKWFQHFSDSHSNLKIRQVIKKYGMEGYGFFWICDELVANQGHNFSIRENEGWMDALESNSRLKVEKITEMLEFFAEINLISKSSLSKGILSIPKLAKYSDDYSRKRVRTMSGHTPDNVLLHNSTVHNSTVHNSTVESTDPSPKEISLKFFEGNQEKVQEVADYLASKGIPEQIARSELSKFISYWTETNSTGKRQRWQDQRYFDLHKRLATWFQRAGQYQKSNSGIQNKIAST